jgi:hypothetical protein
MSRTNSKKMRFLQLLNLKILRYSKHKLLKLDLICMLANGKIR